ncbi:DoxX family membrane protein, partial [Streptomyces sp. SID337]
MTTCTCLDRRDLGLLLLRAGTGGVLAAHGAQKLFGWFGGGGVAGTGAFMESIGYAPGRLNAVVAGVCEA